MQICIYIYVYICVCIYTYKYECCVHTAADRPPGVALTSAHCSPSHNAPLFIQYTSLLFSLLNPINKRTVIIYGVFGVTWGGRTRQRNVTVSSSGTVSQTAGPAVHSEPAPSWLHDLSSSWAWWLVYSRTIRDRCSPPCYALRLSLSDPGLETWRLNSASEFTNYRLQKKSNRTVRTALRNVNLLWQKLSQTIRLFTDFYCSPDNETLSRKRHFLNKM